MGPPWKELPFPRAFIHQLTHYSFAGKEFGPSSRAPMLGKATIQLGGRLVSQRALFVTASPTAIHPIGMALTPWDWGLFLKVYSFRSAVFCTNRVTSRTLCLFTTHRRSWVKRGYVWRIYHLWGKWQHSYWTGATTLQQWHWSAAPCQAWPGPVPSPHGNDLTGAQTQHSSLWPHHTPSI
jgi:hypothetical protein